MSLSLLAAPAEEVLTLADAKAFAKIETSDDDLLVQALIVSARLHVEARTRRFLVTQTWRLGLVARPANGRIALPAAPVQSILAVRMRDSAGNATLVDPSAYQADLAASPPLVTLAGTAPAIGRLELDLVLGYGAAAAVPEPLRHAVRLLVACWYEERGYLAMSGDASLPVAVERLVAPYLIRSL